jgi:RNA polymerase sigma-70 factor (ECF subfamily)
VSDTSIEEAKHRPWAGAFQPTQWSLVLAAGGGSADSSAALEQLCRLYWPAVHAHLRRQGMDPHQSEDLTQEFFARLLSGNSFAAVSPDKGRFRTFLLAALKHFLINEWKRERTLKRGGGVPLVALDGLEAQARDAIEPSHRETPEAAYDRRWALTLLSRVMARMKAEYVAAGQARRFEMLKGYLLEGSGPQSYGETARRLGLTDAAVKSAIYKIRQRFGQMLRAEVSRTVGHSGEVDDEIRCLLEALRG